SVSAVTMDIFFRAGRVGVDLPHFLQRRYTRLTVRGNNGFRERFESVNDAVASREEEKRAPVDFGQRWRRPGAMENVWRNVLVIARNQTAGVLVDGDKARGLGGANALVRIVHAGSGIEVEIVAVNDNRAMRRVVRPNP